MQEIKAVKNGIEVRALISPIGTVTIPSRVREMVGKKAGDFIRIIVPSDQ